ncbi:MAG: DUF2520 domain-containing protein [Thermoanaerobaculia bacterium]
MIADGSPLERVVVLGKGRLGTALTSALMACEVAASARSGRQTLAEGLPADDADAASVVILAVADGAIQPLAESLARSLSFGARAIVLHCSGVLDVSALESLHRQGCAVGSFHPLQTFPDKTERPAAFRGVTFGIEGDLEARAMARKLADRLEGFAVEIHPGTKALYHLAAVLAGNGAVGLIGAARDAMTAAGFERGQALAALGPLVLTSIEGALSRGPEAALSGPVSRGDDATLERHRAALRQWDPERLPLYEALVREQERLVASLRSTTGSC